MSKLKMQKASVQYSLQDVAGVLRDVFEGLRELHTNNICHGCVQLQSVLVEKVDGQFRGRLDFYPFSSSVRFLSVYMNEDVLCLLFR